MFFEKLKQFEERAQKLALQYITNLHIELHSDLPLETRLVNSLHSYFLDPVDAVDPFKSLFHQLTYASFIKQTQGRLCGGILKRGDRAYKCLQCITEQNSILCLDCFDLEKHKGHQFQLITVFGGCCDCGDPEKWRPQTFCQRHSQQEEVKVTLDQELVQRFISDQHVAFKSVLVLYAEYLAIQQRLKGVKLQQPMFTEEDSKRFRASVQTKVRVYLEAYCSLYFQILGKYNSLGSQANAMTHQLFQSRLDLERLPKVQAFAKGETQYFKLLFSFLEFNKTPEKICELCITLFQLQGFRERVTIEYMDLYASLPDFPASSYSHLSSQLFTSYLVIGKLVKAKRVPPLVINPLIQSQSDLDDAAQTFVRYYYDVSYLGKLFGGAGIEYFTYHAQEGKIPALCDYRRIFNDYPSSKDYYGLEEIFINRMVILVQLMQRDTTGYIMRQALRQLYQFFTNFQTRPDNFYRPHQRFFVMVALAYFQGDLERLEDQGIFRQFIQILGVKDLQRECSVIFQNVSSILSFSASLLQNQARASGSFTFYTFYFKKNVSLFNLDALTLQIAIKLCQVHNRLGGRPIDYSRMIRDGDKLYDIVNKMRAYEPRTGYELTTKEIPIALQENSIRHCYNYLTLLNQAATSDLPLLAIKCFMQPSKEDIKKHGLNPYKYASQAFHYYSHLLKSCDNGKPQVKDFKVISDAFFKQEEVFREFIQGHLDSSDGRRLDGEKSKGERISMRYFLSVVAKATGLTTSASLSVLPYQHPRSTVPFIENEIVQLAKQSLYFVANLQRFLQTNNSNNSKTVAGNCQRSIFNFVWMVLVQTKNNSIYEFIQSIMQMKGHENQLEHLAHEIKAYSKTLSSDKQEQTQSINTESSIKEGQLKKQKQSNKRNQMLERMNKNKQHFLQQVEGLQQGDEQQSVCCLCKGAKEGEDNCLIVMFSQGNYFPLAHVSPHNALYTVSTCGHEVHRSCYQKILKKNQIYSFCPLCKTPMNMVLPVLTPNNNQNGMAHFWEEFHKLNKNYNHKSTLEDDAVVIFLSLVGFVAVKGLLFPQSFMKQCKVYRIVTNLLRFYCGKWMDDKQFGCGGQAKTLELVEMGQKERTAQIRQIMQLVANELSYNLLGIGYNFKPQRISTQFQQQARTLISYLCSQTSLESIKPQLPQIINIRKTIISPSIQSTLSNFSSRFMGKCPNCGLVTNQQALCLICPSFFTCFKCQSMNLMTHAHDTHRHACSFIKTHTGEIVYIYRNRYWVFQSVFQDYMGRSYSNAGNKAEFYLNMKKLQQYLDDIVKNGIQSKLRYKEKQSNKVNHNQEI